MALSCRGICRNWAETVSMKQSAVPESTRATGWKFMGVCWVYAIGLTPAIGEVLGGDQDMFKSRLKHGGALFTYFLEFVEGRHRWSDLTHGSRRRDDAESIVLFLWGFAIDGPHPPTSARNEALMQR